jgi:hypothetical protein
MKDIPAEAILFDMYYMAKDPVVLAGEKREPPAVEFKTVDETTPQFRNFFFRNITCNGAATGIFVRGIPEMHIKNILIENAVIQADEGIDIQEASDITLNNITMIPKNTNPVAYVLNSDHITIDNLKYADGAEVLAQVQGERTKAIYFLNTDTSKAKQKLATGFGATEATVSWVKQPVVEEKKTVKPRKNNK